MNMERFENALQRCRTAMERPELLVLKSLLRSLGKSEEECAGMAAEIDERPESHARLSALKDSLERLQPGSTSDGVFERYLILNSVLRVAEDIPSQPVAGSVKDLYSDELLFFATSEPASIAMFQLGQYRFAEMCKIATLRRWPAGQLQWELSGFAKRHFLRVSPAALPRVSHFLATRMKGLRPLFYPHLNGRRKNRWVILEIAQNRAYYRMAKSMELQPNVRGMFTASWFYSPETHRVSPHLAWLSKPFTENGAIVFDLGEDDPNAGALAGSPERMELWRCGKFKPRLAGVLWPREAMLEWARQHPDFERRQ